MFWECVCHRARNLSRAARAAHVMHSISRKITRDVLSCTRQQVRTLLTCKRAVFCCDASWPWTWFYFSRVFVSCIVGAHINRKRKMSRACSSARWQLQMWSALTRFGPACRHWKGNGNHMGWFFFVLCSFYLDCIQINHFHFELFFDIFYFSGCSFFVFFDLPASWEHAPAATVA